LPWLPGSRPGSALEVEVLWRALLEPEPIVLGRVLEKLRRLLEHVIGLLGRLVERMFDVEFGGLVPDVLRRRLGLGRWRGRLGMRCRRPRSFELRFVVVQVIVRRCGLSKRRIFRRGLEHVPFVVIVERLAPIRLGVLVICEGGLGAELSGLRLFRTASDRAERLALCALYLRRVGTSAPLEIEVLANCVVE
jgi:hypothetical protein